MQPGVRQLQGVVVHLGNEALGTVAGNVVFSLTTTKSLCFNLNTSQAYHSTFGMMYFFFLVSVSIGFRFEPPATLHKTFNVFFTNTDHIMLRHKAKSYFR